MREDTDMDAEQDAPGDLDRVDGERQDAGQGAAGGGQNARLEETGKGEVGAGRVAWPKV